MATRLSSNSDFVFGIGNRWANRHTGSIDVYTKGRKFVHVDIEPTQIGRVFGPDFGIVSDARAALMLFIEEARVEGGGQSSRIARRGPTNVCIARRTCCGEAISTRFRLSPSASIRR